MNNKAGIKATRHQDSKALFAGGRGKGVFYAAGGVIVVGVDYSKVQVLVSQVKVEVLDFLPFLVELEFKHLAVFRHTLDWEQEGQDQQDRATCSVTGEEGEVVDVRGAHWNFVRFCCTDETDNVGQDSTDVCDICSPVDPLGVEVGGGVVCNVQFWQVEQTFL